ncbi:MAG: chemotaxis protein CheW [Myxococcales bacterium]|nr:chemotaxis protein CheW [Myxococcales bacterium]
MTTTDDEILREFLVESYENLDRLDRDFVALESTPDDIERISAIFRTIHTIKGTSGFLGFQRLEALTHVGESLLAKLRDRQLSLTPDLTTALLSMVDGVRAILASVERTGEEGTEDYTAVRAQLVQMSSPRAPSAPPVEAKAPVAPAAPSPTAAAPQPAIVDEAVAAPVAAAAPATPAPAPAKPAEVDDPHASSAAVDASIRVDVGLLDKLMNLVGELVLARNQILQFSTSTSSRDTALIATSQRINLITTELQEGVMKTRMQPIGNVWAKFPRVVRDLSMMCKKQVRIAMDGKETELDRTIIEAIKDPLTHVVRNAVDHGIESPEVRVKAGKDPMGTLHLRAYHAGGQVNIEISDDGAGLDPDKIRRKAIERGLVAPEQAQRMTDREVAKLVFLPGFSTAEKVTNVSGRGVGMDVVKTNIEKIGGAVDLESRPGKGTTLKIKIPLTLAIIPALLVQSRTDRFAIPQASLLELVRIDAEQNKAAGGPTAGPESARIEYVHGTPVYRLRGSLLPLVFLSHALGDESAPRVSDDGSVNIVVVQADGRQFGLVVDGISDTEEIVVKPLGKELKGLNVFAGATIMGDGRVALILDVVGLAQRVSLGSSGRERTLGEAARTEGRSDDRQTLLLFRTGTEGNRAVPLSMVARLEEFQRDRVERAGKRAVVQYRGEIMPLIDLGELLDGAGFARAKKGEEPLQVIVTSHAGRRVGLVVDRIVDIVDEHVTLQDGGRQNGVLGAAVVQGKVTELLDITGVIRAVEPQMLEKAS